MTHTHICHTHIYIYIYVMTYIYIWHTHIYIYMSYVCAIFIYHSYVLYSCSYGTLELPSRYATEPSRTPRSGASTAEVKTAMEGKTPEDSVGWFKHWLVGDLEHQWTSPFEILGHWSRLIYLGHLYHIWLIWWLEPWNFIWLSHHIGNGIIIPTDELHHFSEG